MASTGDPDLQNLSNYNPERLDMSEIRVVLLGNSLSERIAAVNFILEVPLFSRKEEPDYTPVRGLFNDLELVLINTPDVLDPNMSEDKLTEFMENTVRLSTPRPHVFLLVLQPEDFTEEHDQRLHRVLKLFADRPFDHALVLLSTPKTKALHFMKKNRLPPCLKDLIKVCDYRFPWR
ncbi:GTPase IMAP family member 2-like [Fundulus heteroclitus]|uniref:GTPase IMAP family member 2-like n=1 Tax=Fundulus heteroclitus TaxID=8078 RepID=UPI00165A6EBB|nr:GTPase IMAP family member 2-like [Fundulus heteroclitus]